MKVELTREDWEQALTAGIDLLKNAMAQVEVYKIHVELAEKMVKKFPEPKKKKEKV